MNNFLLLGGNGFLGRNISETLQNYGKNVVNFDTIKGNSNCLKGYIGTLCDTKKIIDIIETNNIDVVVHLISSLHTSDGMERFLEELENVVVPTYRLIDYLKDKAIKIIFISSGGTIYHNENDSPRKETDLLNPITYYGYSKKLIEDYIVFNEKFGLNYLILRVSNPFGKYQNINGKQGVIGIFIKNILEGKKIQIYGDGENKRDYLYIDDFNRAFVNLIYEKNRIINVGSGQAESLNDILKVIKKIHGHKFSIEYLPNRNTDIKSICLDTSLLREIESKKEYITLEKGIEEFYNYVKEILGKNT